MRFFMGVLLVTNIGMVNGRWQMSDVGFSSVLCFRVILIR